MNTLPPASSRAEASALVTSRPGRVNAEEAAQRHLRVLAAARAVFIEQGLARASLDAVAREARVTKRTLYLQYGSKEGLFVAVLKDVVDGIAAKVRTAMREERDLAGELTTLARAYTLAMDGDEPLAIYRLAIGESARLPAQVREAINLYGERSALGVVTARLQALQARGLVSLHSLDDFVHLYLDLVLLPRFSHWLINGTQRNAAPAVVAREVQRFLWAAAEFLEPPPPGAAHDTAPGPRK